MAHLYASRRGNPEQCGCYTPPASSSSSGSDRGSWTMVAPMLQGVDHASAGTDGTKLYIFGGRSNGVNVNDAGCVTLIIITCV